MYKKTKKIVSECIKDAKIILAEHGLEIDTNAIVQLALKLTEVKFTSEMIDGEE